MRLARGGAWASVRRCWVRVQRDGAGCVFSGTCRGEKEAPRCAWASGRARVSILRAPVACGIIPPANKRTAA